MYNRTRPAMLARARYKKKAYDTVTFYPPKGWQDIVKGYAYSHNMSLASLLRGAVEKFMQENP